MLNIHKTRPLPAAVAAALLAATLLAGTAGSALACEDGYYRFGDKAEASRDDWLARSADYEGDGPRGLSVFMDLSEEQYQTMADARLEARGATYVYLVGCDALVDPLTYTAAPTNNDDWTAAGGDNHGVISATDANSGRQFNRTNVGDVKAPDYLAGHSVQVYAAK